MGIAWHILIMVEQMFVFYLAEFGIKVDVVVQKQWFDVITPQQEVEINFFSTKIK